MPIRRLILPLSLACALAQAAEGPQRLDAHFVDDRVLVDAPLAAGGHLRFFTDTGGGPTRLTFAATERLHLPTGPLPPEAGKVPRTWRMIDTPLPLAPSALPSPPLPGYAVDRPIDLKDMPEESDGALGSNWFAGHVWSWNYVAGTLTLERPDWTPPRGAQVIPVGLPPGPADRPGFPFPRIEITIAGEPTSMLLDTGATTVLTPEAAQRLGGPRLRSTSMIVASRIAAWRKAHPQWRVIEHAQSGTGDRMIEVPDVRIAGLQVGPVWFTERPDYNFKELMSAAMDATVLGSIGGNAFHTLAMTIDYPHARAAFERATR